MARENYIGGTWRAAEVRRDRRGVATRRPANCSTRSRRATASTSTKPSAAAGAAFGEWSRTTPRHAVRDAARKVADAIDADIETIQDLEIRNVGKPASIIDFEMDLTVDNWRFFAERRTLPRGPGRGRVPRGSHLVHPARPARCRRVDRAVELPAEHGDLEGRPRARGRQHRRAEAVGAHAAQRVAPGRDHRRTSSRPVCSTSSPARARPRAPRSSRTPTSRWCRSPATSRPARSSRGRRPTRSSACTSSSAARRR